MHKFQQHISSSEPKEILFFQEKCFSCTSPGTLNMVVTEVPYFKEMVVMAFHCDHCGYRTNEVKASGAISERGTKITLQVNGHEDMCRDLLKSETATIFIPEIDLEITEGSMGGRFTTIEGLLSSLREQLTSMRGIDVGHSNSDIGTIEKGPMAKFLDRLSTLERGEEPFTLVLDDPVSNSFIQNPFAPDMDPQMIIEQYIRTWQQDEDLGLHQIWTGDIN
jgi:zinc finger protein